MDLRWVTRDSVRVLQKYCYTGTELIGDELVQVYEWQDVPDGVE